MESQLDGSVNFVWHLDRGQIEARYVRRVNERFIVYLSVQTGCALGCRMCHLTQSKQVAARDLTVAEILMQAETVLAWFQKMVGRGEIEAATVVDFSFMARGDFFNNPHLIAQADDLLRSLEEMARELNLQVRIKISTIMPRAIDGARLTEDVFRQSTPDLYYSLYSVDPHFRKRWLPRALNPESALAMLTGWQAQSRKLVILHSAFIAGENDSRASINAMAEMIWRNGLRCDYNVVRYNPFSDVFGAETPHLGYCVAWLKAALPQSHVKVIDRVGSDVYASCGMFNPA